MLYPIQLLKLKLMADGLAVSPRAREALSSRPLTLADYATTSGMSLVLGEDVWVNAPLRDHNPNFVTEAPPHVFDLEDSGYVVLSEGQTFPARPIPVPDYHDQKNSSEEPYTSYAITHTDRVRISPIQGCGMVCTFCDLPYEHRYHRMRVDGLVDSVGRALVDQTLPARHVLISGGTPKPEDFNFLRTVYQEVPKRFPGIAVDIMMVPAPGLLDIRELREFGIHGLSINLEIFSREVARKVMRQKYDMGLPYYLDFIEQAVGAFGPGRVRSLLLVGLEPLEDTLRGVEALAERGCDPVLSPFRPDPSTPLRKTPPPSVEDLTEVYERALEIVERHGVKLGPRCIPCHHNTLTFPDGSGEYMCH
jgi:hypothetical protein